MGSPNPSLDLLSALETFLKTHQIPHVKPLSAPYPSLRSAYNTSFNSVVPLCIARPRNPEDVALIIKLAVSPAIPFTIRAGGHDLFGRCFRAGALAIDLRDLT
jgi:FAD/FMN-containing dehydrogenase